MARPLWPRSILHVDMDAFYAAVEVLDCQTQRLIGGVILNAGIILNRWRGTQRRVGHVGVWIGGKAPAQREA